MKRIYNSLTIYSTIDLSLGFGSVVKRFSRI